MSKDDCKWCGKPALVSDSFGEAQCARCWLKGKKEDKRADNRRRTGNR